MPDTPTPPGPTGPEEPEGLPPELAEVLRSLTGGADLPPEVVQQLRSMGIADADPQAISMMAQQVKAMFSAPAGEGPVSATQAGDVARQTVEAAGDEEMGEEQHRLADQAGRVAALWLDEVTAFEAPGLRGVPWSRRQWVDATMPVWLELVEPVAEGVAHAVGGAMRGRLEGLTEGDLPPGLVPPGMDPAAMLSQIEPLVERMSGSMFSMQLGQAVGALAGETVTGTEVSLPLTPADTLALLPGNIAAFAEGLEIDLEQVWLYLAVREAARVRLFADVPWLGPQLLTAVQDYARDITIDTEGIERAVESVDPTDAQALQDVLSGSLFSPEPSTSQQAALTRLETWLALIEGWVDVVSARAAGAHLPQAGALGETVRRRRATGGPAEKTFAALVGLELRPRRLRDAANLWSALESRLGQEARDRAWDHPDVAPSAADLDDPLGYVERRAAGGGDDIDAALDEILRDGDG